MRIRLHGHHNPECSLVRRNCRVNRLGRPAADQIPRMFRQPQPCFHPVPMAAWSIPKARLELVSQPMPIEISIPNVRLQVEDWFHDLPPRHPAQFGAIILI